MKKPYYLLALIISLLYFNHFSLGQTVSLKNKINCDSLKKSGDCKNIIKIDAMGKIDFTYTPQGYGEEFGNFKKQPKQYLSF